jgi:hypothetical protein
MLVFIYTAQNTCTLEYYVNERICRHATLNETRVVAPRHHHRGTELTVSPAPNHSCGACRVFKGVQGHIEERSEG